MRFSKFSTIVVGRASSQMQVNDLCLVVYCNWQFDGFQPEGIFEMQERLLDFASMLANLLRFEGLCST